MPYENINSTISDADNNQILFELDIIKNLMPFLINLTKKERQQKGAFIRQKELFSITAFEIATKEPSLVPQNLDMQGWENDIELLKQLNTIHRIIMQLEESLSDTIIAVKTENAKTSSLFYNSLKLQAKFNTPGVDAMVNKLKGMLHKKKNIDD